MTLQTRDQIQQLLKKKLKKAQLTMKHFVDQHRIAHPFKKGDLVMDKLCLSPDLCGGTLSLQTL